MKNGLYQTTEFKIVIYQNEDDPEEVFVTITYGEAPNEPKILTGEVAKKFVEGML